MEPKTDFEPADRPCIKSEETYPDYVAVYDSVQHEHWDGVNEVKTENPIFIEVKSEIPGTEQTVNNMKLEYMDTLTPKEELDVFEYDEDPLSDSRWDSAQIDRQWEREQKHSQVEEEKQLFSCYICNFTDNSKISLIAHIKRNNCYVEPSLKKSRCVSSKLHRPNEYFCTKCDEVFKSKTSLDDHVIRKHVESIESVSSKIHGCTLCDFKTVHKSHLTRHMLTHTAFSDYHSCEHCDTSFKIEQSLFDHILLKHPEFSGTVPCKVYECIHCAYKTTSMRNVTKHMAEHETNFTGHVAERNTRTFQCTNCNASFKAKLRLDNHILQKHSELAASVSRKIHECTYCEYKTTYAHCLASHMMKHTGTKVTCTKCDASFTNKRSLDNHVLQKHRELTASVSHKIHECTHCGYKTTDARCLTAHSIKCTGSELTCTDCGASFTKKISLDDHILKVHPESTASVSHMIYECTHCGYKTVGVQEITMHMVNCTGSVLTCVQCNAPFTTKLGLDNHILQKHPESTAFVSRKIHECAHCEYKTTYVRQLTMHMMKHAGPKLTCTKCDALFMKEIALDNHILQKHPELTASVSCRIYECTHCEYKTTYAQCLDRHMMKHAQSAKTESS